MSSEGHFSLEPHQFISSENWSLSAYSAKCVRFARLFCSKCLEARTVPGAEHSNRTWICQWPSKKDHFLGKGCEGSHSQGEGGLFGSPLRKEGKGVGWEEQSTKLPITGALQELCRGGWVTLRIWLGWQGRHFHLPNSFSFCFIIAFLLSDTVMTLDSLLRESWWQWHMWEEQSKQAQHLLWESQSCLFLVCSVRELA